MISLARRRVTTSDIDRGPDRMRRPSRMQPLRTTREQRAAGRGRDLDRDQRARQHHRFEAEIDEPPMRLTNPPIAASKIGVVVSSAAWMNRLIMTAALTRPAKPELSHGEDHDSALQDLDDLDRHVAEQLDIRASRRQGSEQHRSDSNADRGIAREQSDRNAGEAVARREAGDEAMDEAKRMDAAGEPADDARGDHRAKDDPRQFDADRPAEAWIKADESRTRSRQPRTGSNRRRR